MASQLFHCPEPIIPSENEVELARTSSRILSAVTLKKAKSVDISLEIGNHHRDCVTLPFLLLSFL